MGWKTVKDHYKIGHIVHVTDKGICIGSPYVHDLITISPDGTVKEGVLGLSGNDDLQRYYRDLTADKEMLVKLINEKDVFAADTVVYTYDGGDIITEHCELPGWPNVTHEGHLMNDGYSTDINAVAKRAKRNARAAIELMANRVDELRCDLSRCDGLLAEHKADLAKLQENFPDTPIAT